MIGLIMLVVFVLYLLVAISVTSWLARIPKRVPYKWLTALLSLAMFALIPTWDEILGRMYFKHLCETEGGVKVYKVGELPAQYWGENGVPKDRIEKTSSGEHEIRIGGNYSVEGRSWKGYGKAFRIDKEHQKIKDTRNNEVLSELTYFGYWGGWLINSTGLHVTASSCPDLRIYETFYRETFVRGR